MGRWMMGGWMGGNDHNASLVFLKLFCEFVNVGGLEC